MHAGNCQLRIWIMDQPEWWLGQSRISSPRGSVAHGGMLNACCTPGVLGAAPSLQTLEWL